MPDATLIVQSQDKTGPYANTRGDHIIPYPSGGTLTIADGTSYLIIVGVNGMREGETCRVTIARTDSVLYDQQKDAPASGSVSHTLTVSNAHLTEGYAIGILVGDKAAGINIYSLKKSYVFTVYDASKPPYSQPELDHARDTAVNGVAEAPLNPFPSIGGPAEIQGAIGQVLTALGGIVTAFGLPAILTFVAILLLPQILGGVVGAFGSSIRRAFG